MDQHWLTNLDKNAAVLVPTRSLANTLNEQVAAHYIGQGKTVWEAPNILIWGDYVKALWQMNKHDLQTKFGARHVISSQQSLLLWTQIIETARREEQALTLLNVQQTARAVQRSWTLMHDWRISIDALSQDHVADTVQFIKWLNAYQALLSKRGLLDEPMLLNALCNHDNDLELRFPYQRITFYAFDLINAAQKAINEQAEHSYINEQPIQIEHREPAEKKGALNYSAYSDSDAEISACLENARTHLEQDPDCTINIVIHDLQDRQTQVHEIARRVFYPSASPLEVQQNSTAYRFSLGQRLNEWAAIETALSVIGLLKNRVNSTDLSFLLRNQFLGLCAAHRVECRAFDRWLKRQRMRAITFDQLPKLYQECTDYLEQKGLLGGQEPCGEDAGGLLHALTLLVEKRQQMVATLELAKETSDFAALSFTNWVAIFNQWLEDWGWSTKTVGRDLNTVQHQLLKRWEGLLQEFSGLATVQRQAGISKAVELLQQMTRDTMFLPKAAASPILISSILEAIGRPADYSYILGMSDAFPPAPKNDAFIPQRLLASAGHPDMSADSSFVQADKVMSNLLRSLGDTTISFASRSDLDSDIVQHCSALFRKKEFHKKEHKLTEESVDETSIEFYQDTQAPAWPASKRASGGSKIFENQSNCAFKAFVTHQLTFQVEQEAEFGLDFLDRGNIVHYLLDVIWANLHTQKQLIASDLSARSSLINAALDQALCDPELGLTTDKRALLKLERPRLISLLQDWLAFEETRPEHFSVIEREEERTGMLGGIEFTYIIDRLDMSDDGRTFVIDYKTGLVSRNDWIGEPIKSPQMPLYAVALAKAKNKPVSGIAYASIRQHDHKYDELSEAGVFRKEDKRTLDREEVWRQCSDNWEVIFLDLANQFLSGKADVNPIDEKICDYCDLSAVCRVSQLRKQSFDQTPPLSEEAVSNQITINFDSIEVQA